MAGLQIKFQDFNTNVNKMLTTDGRTSSIHQLELFCNPAKSTVGQNQSNYTKSHMSNS